MWNRVTVIVVCVAVAVAACEEKPAAPGSVPASPATTSAAAAATPPAPTAPKSAVPSSHSSADSSASAPKGASTAASQDTSSPPAGSIRPDCNEPLVLLRRVARSKHAASGFSWRWAEQLLLAFPKFALTAGPPDSGQVSLLEASSSESGQVGLVARCFEPATCTDLADAYRRLAVWSHPKPVCGRASLPFDDFAPAKVGGTSELTELLPSETDVETACIRLAACRQREDPGGPRDLARSCWRRPMDFETSCATRFPCSAVRACEDRRR